MSKDRKCKGVCDDCSVEFCPYEDKKHLTDEEMRELLEKVSFELNYWFGDALSLPED